MMPFMGLVLAVGLAFADQTNKQTDGWVERNGSPYKLKSTPCTNGNEACKVIFADDPSGTVHPVYMDQSLQQLKLDGNGTPYIVSE